MHKIYRSELDCCPMADDHLIDNYSNVWQVVKTYKDYVTAVRLQKNYSPRAARTMGRIDWNSNLRRDDAKNNLQGKNNHGI